MCTTEAYENLLGIRDMLEAKIKRLERELDEQTKFARDMAAENDELRAHKEAEEGQKPSYYVNVPAGNPDGPHDFLKPHEWAKKFTRCLYSPLYTRPIPSQQKKPMFQAACSGLWYENPEACGEVSAVKVGENYYRIPSQQAVPDDRMLELAERLVAPGPKCCALSASECHEISDFIRDLAPAPSQQAVPDGHVLVERAIVPQHVVDAGEKCAQLIMRTGGDARLIALAAFTDMILAYDKDRYPSHESEQLQNLKAAGLAEGE